MNIAAFQSHTPSTARAAVPADAGTEAALPDLVITDIGFVPSPPLAGSTARLQVTVRNQGNADAGTFEVTVSEDAKGSQRVEGLPAGTQQVIDFGSMRIPQFKELLRIQGEIDVRGQVTESREDNNWIIAYESVSNPTNPWPPTPPLPTPPLPPIPHGGAQS